MENKDIRWQQRFEKFERALGYLEEGINIKDPDTIQKAGIIQFFEMSFELAWKTLKDYLEEQGYINVKSPRAVLKLGFEIDLIKDGHSWLKLLDDRNITSHAYDEEKVNELETLIVQQYYPLLKQFADEFRNKD